MKYIKNSLEVDATQWFRNGDHPLDHDPLGIEDPSVSELRRYRDYLSFEGKIVRYFRDPGIDGMETRCPVCDEFFHVHGWIDDGKGGYTVCPGDWIVTNPTKEDNHYPVPDKVFKKLYSPVPDNKLDILVQFMEGLTGKYLTSFQKDILKQFIR